MFDLLPSPRQIVEKAGSHALNATRWITIQCDQAAGLHFTAQRLQTVLLEKTGLEWGLSARRDSAAAEAGIILRLQPGGSEHPQGYVLDISPGAITIQAGSEAGIFYAVCTLIQLIKQAACQDNSCQLPCLHIADWPDFPVRGVLLDISRDKVPTMETLYALVDMLAGWKINQLQLYTEHTFAYRQHPTVWAEASPMTGQEILDLDAFCRQRFIDLVPNQSSFGHMERWLRHPEYAGLAETHGTFIAPWGEELTGPFSLCPIDPGSLALLQSLYDELLPHFSSRLFNVNCDETFDLGTGRSREACAERGVERVYLDFLLEVYRAVNTRGRTMLFWGDIILHTPELISELPRDVIALDWGYEGDHPFDTQGAHFAASGIPFYVCPGTSSWTSITGRTDNALANLLNAAQNGLKHGAIGYLNTDWGDNGHWQTLPVSYLGFAAGAAYCWTLEANRSLDVARAISLHAFDDPTSNMGRVAYDLGNIYKLPGYELPNSSIFFWLLQFPLQKLHQRSEMIPPPDVLERALAAVDQALAPLARADSRRPDAELSRREFELGGRMLRHAIRRAELVLGSRAISMAELHREILDIQQEYREIWLKRNRPGGLNDSLARFDLLDTHV
jgi:hypothetical protein